MHSSPDLADFAQMTATSTPGMGMKATGKRKASSPLISGRASLRSESTGPEEVAVSQTSHSPPGGLTQHIWRTRDHLDHIQEDPFGNMRTEVLHLLPIGAKTPKEPPAISKHDVANKAASSFGLSMEGKRASEDLSPDLIVTERNTPTPSASHNNTTPSPNETDPNSRIEHLEQTLSDAKVVIAKLRERLAAATKTSAGLGRDVLNLNEGLRLSYDAIAELKTTVVQLDEQNSDMRAELMKMAGY